MVIAFLLTSFLFLLPIQNGCQSNNFGLTSLGSWGGPVKSDLPNDLTWQITLYDSKEHPEMVAAYLVINRSRTIRSNSAIRPVALPGKKVGQWLVFRFPNSGEIVKARKMPNNKLKVLHQASDKTNTFLLPSSTQHNELVVYGEICQQWKESFKEGKWSTQLFP